MLSQSSSVTPPPPTPLLSKAGPLLPKAGPACFKVTARHWSILVFEAGLLMFLPWTFFSPESEEVSGKWRMIWIIQSKADRTDCMICRLPFPNNSSFWFSTYYLSISCFLTNDSVSPPTGAWKAGGNQEQGSRTRLSMCHTRHSVLSHDPCTNPTWPDLPS